jgi:hypothetical protein
MRWLIETDKRTVKINTERDQEKPVTRVQSVPFSHSKKNSGFGGTVVAPLLRNRFEAVDTDTFAVMFNS